DGDIISGIRLSTVVPASVAGEGISHHFTNTDLAFKLHYLSTLHLFTGEAAKDLTIADLKEPMFQWLRVYYGICGRIRRDDSDGRLFLKCNDSGVRIVEAICSKTVAEWIDGGDYQRGLVYHQPFLGDNFEFTPLVFLQLTRFKCGGLGVGMRWAHIIGDGFKALDSIKAWGKILAGEMPKPPPPPLTTPTSRRNVDSAEPPSASPCRSLKPLTQSLGGTWLTPNNVKLQTHTFHFSEKHLAGLMAAADRRYGNHGISSFEIISALIWKYLAEIKTAATDTVTLVKKRKGDFDGRILGNGGLEIGIVDFAFQEKITTDSDPLEIAKAITDRFVDETKLIEETAKWDLDFLIYGSNLTFVDLIDADLYGLKLKGEDAAFANLSVGGVGDEGAVVVVPGREHGIATVNAILPEDQTVHLK
ncbi:hypothetical protein M569_11925, partial [Genlisea aurea]